jgi:hypothetical protein
MVEHALTPLMMIRPSLEGFPTYPLPAPFSVRWYQPREEPHWLAMKARADHFTARN